MTAISEIYNRTYSVPEYLALERQSGQKFEYYHGKIYQMAGGTIQHNRISRNMQERQSNLIKFLAPLLIPF